MKKFALDKLRQNFAFVLLLSESETTKGGSARIFVVEMFFHKKMPLLAERHIAHTDRIVATLRKPFPIVPGFYGGSTTNFLTRNKKQGAPLYRDTQIGFRSCRNAIVP